MDEARPSLSLTSAQPIIVTSAILDGAMASLPPPDAGAGTAAVVQRPSAAAVFALEVGVGRGDGMASLPVSSSSVSGAPSTGTAVHAVYEESVATGTFRRMHASDALASTWGRNTSSSSKTDTSNDEAVPPDYSMARGLQWYNNFIWRTSVFIMAGAVLFLVIAVVKQRDDYAAGVSNVANFLAPLRLIMYLLSMLAWLGMADQVLQLRAAAKQAIDAAFKARTAHETGAGSLAVATLLGQQHRQALARSAAMKVALFAQTVVVATVLASNVLDNRIRMQAGRAPSAIAADASIMTDFEAWRVLLYVRLGGALLALLATVCSLEGPLDVDALVAERLLEAAPALSGAAASAAAAAAVAAAAAAGTSAAAASVVDVSLTSPAALCAAIDGASESSLASMPPEQARALAAAAAALLRRVDAVGSAAAAASARR